ncbi:MAG: thiamine-binding protein [Spirochaetales bacterium]|jgi:uncharacterized protein (TIGR00106 family)|nr:thiamine-binding protein [Exilispira sp.]NMC67314.1 thiamine-binding protein [Spirochaetales bacterium]
MQVKSSCAIQVVPIGIEDKSNMYEFIDFAINIIKESNLKYLVTPFETVIEGNLVEILALIEKVNDTLLKKGLKTICMNIKLWSGDIGTIEEKLEKYT